MKCFNYKIYDNDQLVLKNSINANSKEEALALLQEDHDGATIKIIEVTPANNWSC
jgi:type II secretory pathway component PulF